MNLEFIFKVIDKVEWQKAKQKGTYDGSDKDKKDGYSLNIKMTLTAPGCGMGPSIAQDVDNKVSALPGVNDVLVEVVWDPVWDQSMMSEDARLKLGMF